ncbi:hypothetical protein GF362_05380 [Candidatus Dojkabacteria bacterium]|nr:hypothetical protein [Candidatus Dojkabacteria bacterium]
MKSSNQHVLDKKFKLQIIGLLCTTIISTIVSILLFYNKKSTPEVLGDIATQANVYGCRLDLTVKPEKREINNWSTDLDIEIYDETNTILKGTYSTTTNNLGKDSTNICEDLIPPIYLDTGYYYFYIKGKSHISKEYSLVYAFERVLTTIDFSTNNKLLIAGDTNSSRDDEINSLDITHLIRTLHKRNGIDPEYNDSYDLNLDGIINFDDTNILIDNFYLVGQNIH